MPTPQRAPRSSSQMTRASDIQKIFAVCSATRSSKIDHQFLEPSGVTIRVEEPLRANAGMHKGAETIGATSTVDALAERAR